MGFLDNVTTLSGKLVTLRPISREDTDPRLRSHEDA